MKQTMSEKVKVCPFNKNMKCKDCTLYRGRHNYHCATSNVKNEDTLKDLENLLNPSRVMENYQEDINVKITYVDDEEITRKEVHYTELKDLDWGNPFFLRKIDGLHCSSYEKLLNILKFKQMEGKDSVELVERPIHMNFA